jgi:hypothetical protein
MPRPFTWRGRVPTSYQNLKAGAVKLVQHRLLKNFLVKFQGIPQFFYREFHGNRGDIFGQTFQGKTRSTETQNSRLNTLRCSRFLRQTTSLFLTDFLALKEVI